MISKAKKLSIGVFLSAACVGLAIGQAALRYTAKVGDVRKYKVSTKVEWQGNQMSIAADVTIKVTKVDDAGLVTLQASSTNLVATTSDGVSVPSGDSPALLKVFRPDGTLSELHGEGATPEAYRLETLTSVKLPDTPLQKDKTWTWEIPADSKTGIVKSTVVFNVIGDEKVAGVDAWKISRSAKELTGDTPAADEGTVWINKLDASLVKQSDTWKNAPVAHAPGPVNGTFAVELQP